MKPGQKRSYKRGMLADKLSDFGLFCDHHGECIHYSSEVHCTHDKAGNCPTLCVCCKVCCKRAWLFCNIFLVAFVVLAIACCSFLGVAHLNGYHCLQEGIFDNYGGNAPCDNEMEDGVDAQHLALGMVAIALILFLCLACLTYSTVNGMVEARECHCCGSRYNCIRREWLAVGPFWPFRCYLDKMRLKPLKRGHNTVCRPHCCFIIPCASRQKASNKTIFPSMKRPQGYDLVLLKSRRDAPCGFVCW
jgi:hypothetical protein